MDGGCFQKGLEGKVHTYGWSMDGGEKRISCWEFANKIVIEHKTPLRLEGST